MARTNETIKRGPRGATTQQWMYQCRSQTEVRHKDNTYKKNKLASCKMILQILIVQTVYSQHTAHSETFKQGHLACNLITEHLPFNVNVILSTYIKYSAGFIPLRGLLCFELKTIYGYSIVRQLARLSQQLIGLHLNDSSCFQLHICLGNKMNASLAILICCCRVVSKLTGAYSVIWNALIKMNPQSLLINQKNVHIGTRYCWYS